MHQDGQGCPGAHPRNEQRRDRRLMRDPTGAALGFHIELKRGTSALAGSEGSKVRSSCKALFTQKSKLAQVLLLSWVADGRGHAEGSKDSRHQDPGGQHPRVPPRSGGDDHADNCHQGTDDPYSQRELGFVQGLRRRRDRNLRSLGWRIMDERGHVTVVARHPVVGRVHAHRSATVLAASNDEVHGVRLWLRARPCRVLSWKRNLGVDVDGDEIAATAGSAQADMPVVAAVIVDTSTSSACRRSRPRAACPAHRRPHRSRARSGPPPQWRTLSRLRPPASRIASPPSPWRDGR